MKKKIQIKTNCQLQFMSEHLAVWFDTPVGYTAQDVIAEYISAMSILRYGLIFQWTTAQDVVAEYMP